MTPGWLSAAEWCAKVEEQRYSTLYCATVPGCAKCA